MGMTFDLLIVVGVFFSVLQGAGFVRWPGLSQARSFLFLVSPCVGVNSLARLS
jgi:hypothetical protein